MTTQPTGSVLVVGGGIAGIQASLDLADSGYRVVLAEQSSAIGGTHSGSSAPTCSPGSNA